MINIDDRLLSKVDEDELWLLLHIVKRFNENLVCWPSNKKLCEDTKWSLKKMQSVKASLIAKEILVAKQRFNKDIQSSNEYSLDTDLMGVYVPVKRMKIGLQPDQGELNLLTPPESDSGTPPESVLPNKVLTNEVLTNEHTALPSLVYDYFDLIRKRCEFRGDVKRTPARIKLVTALLKLKYSIQDFKDAINHVFHEWCNNPKMRQHLTPETIFRPSNFPKYVEAAKNRPVKDWTEDNNVAATTNGGQSVW